MLRFYVILLLISPCLQNDSISQNSKFYLNLGESYVITNENVSFSTNYSNRNRSVLQIETCPFCVISIKFMYLNLKDDCMKIPHFLDPATCRCSYIWIAEPSYEKVSGTPFCGYWNGAISFGINEQKYKSQTRAVDLSFFFMDNETYEFTMYLTSERNRKFFSGNPQSSGVTNMAAGFLTSPFFPANYPRDLVSEYIISCVKYPYLIHHSIIKDMNPNVSCNIMLIFTDFQLSSLSVMEIFNGNQERIGLVSGLSFRPSVIGTNSSRLRIRFTANGGQGFGFKAMYSFIEGNHNKSLLHPNTDCGGLVEDLGGAITMVNMVRDGRKVFDCVWLVRPSESYSGINGNLYLKVNAFTNFDYAEMEIREGLFSESPVVEKILHSSPYGKEHVTSLKYGFYINLKAVFGPSSVLGITFTSFHYNKCFTGPEFLCLNDRCVPRKVVCDGFDHCGDGTDESDLCYKGWTKISDRKSDGLTPNYYFRKVEHFSELKTVAMIFTFSSLGLVLFLAALIIFLYKMGPPSRQQTDVQSRLHSIAELLDDVEIEEIINDDPPNYEDPPDYEAAIKETARLSEQLQLDVHEDRLQNSELCSQEAEAIFIELEALPNVINGGVNEKCSDYENFKYLLQNNIRLLPNASPPPYTENEDNNLSSPTVDEHIGSSVSTHLPSYGVNDQDQSCNTGLTNEEECT